MPAVNRTLMMFVKQSDSNYPVLHKMNYFANDITNSARFHIRMPHIKAFHKGKLYPFNYQKLWNEFKYEAKRNQTNLTHVLGGAICQQILRNQVNNFKTNVKSIAAFNKRPALFGGVKPKMTGYNKKHTYASFRIPSNCFKFSKVKQEIILCKNKPKSLWWRKEMKHNIKLHTKNKVKSVKSILVVPRFFYIELAISIRIKVPKLQKDNGRYLGIDPGYDNLMTVSSNVPSIDNLIIKGGRLKRYNYKFYKKKQHLQKKLPKKKYTSTKILKMYAKQKLIKHHVIHRACNIVINHAIKHHISVIIFGTGASDAQHKSNLSKVINQGYCDTPFGELFKVLQYKGINHGISVLPCEESYTSQSSFLNKEKPTKWNGNKARRDRGAEHSTRRGPRGLYTSYVHGTPWIVNSDINGALQIIKKLKPNAFKKLRFKQLLQVVSGIKVFNIRL